MRWSDREAQQRLDEVLAAAESEPQIVTRQDEEVAAVLTVAEYRRLLDRGDQPSDHSRDELAE